MSSSPAERRGTGGPAGAWGILGTVAILLYAIVRLTPVALESIDHVSSPWQWIGYAASLVFFWYTEAYRGFHLQFSPRVVVRAASLGPSAPRVRRLLAPLFCMGLFHASRRRLLSSWILTFAIVGFVVVIRRLHQPWRGMIDLGVASALLLGTLSIAWFWRRQAAGEELPIDPDLPP